jgi:peptidyl-prolyl cis-trans isomerase B (cyclophilin B)
VPDFIVQGGNIATRETRTNEMTDRAYRKIPDEPSLIKHERGIVSMARGEEPNTASSNFFILLGSGSHLDGTFAAFGRVTKGMEVVEAIGKMPVENEKPEKPVKIKTATVIVCTPQVEK